jgi:hypothetical protein
MRSGDEPHSEKLTLLIANRNQPLLQGSGPVPDVPVILQMTGYAGTAEDE